VGKKNKKDILKRHLRSKQKAKKRRELRRGSSGIDSPIEEVRHYRPGISEMGAPPGFRAIPMAQAMMEYAKPLVEIAEAKGRDINDALQVSLLLWNYALSLKDGKSDLKLEEKILKSLGKTLRLDEKEANVFMRKMVERKSYLFPPDQQSSDHFLPFMFIRKEVKHPIRPFDYNQLNLSEEKIPADQKDTGLIDKIKKLDALVASDCDWDEMEKLLSRVEDEAMERFENWLGLKGISEGSRFSSCLGIFFSFVYGYDHEDVVLLKSVSNGYFLEFFEDFLLRKMMVEPNEYVDWPPALKMFYTFLHEKNYLENPDLLISSITRIEPNFINILRKQFS